MRGSFIRKLRNIGNVRTKKRHTEFPRTLKRITDTGRRWPNNFEQSSDVHGLRDTRFKIAVPVYGGSDKPSRSSESCNTCSTLEGPHLRTKSMSETPQWRQASSSSCWTWTRLTRCPLAVLGNPSVVRGPSKSAFPRKSNAFLLPPINP